MRLSILIALAVVLVTSCRRNDPVVPTIPPIETFEEMLLRMEFVRSADLLSHADGPEPSVHLIHESFSRARKHYAAADGRALDIRMAQFSFYRPANVDVTNGAPRIPYGNDRWAQGYIVPPGFIAYAHERAVYCEALHGIALILGDPGWMETGHGGPLDKLNFECWRVIQDEWRTEHSQ